MNETNDLFSKFIALTSKYGIEKDFLYMDGLVFRTEMKRYLVASFNLVCILIAFLACVSGLYLPTEIGVAVISISCVLFLILGVLFVITAIEGKIKWFISGDFLLDILNIKTLRIASDATCPFFVLENKDFDFSYKSLKEEDFYKIGLNDIDMIFRELDKAYKQKLMHKHLLCHKLKEF